MPLVAKILTKFQAMEFAKRSLRVACLVPPVAAKWLIHYARRLLIRHKAYAVPLLHLNPELGDEVDIYPVLDDRHGYLERVQVSKKTVEQSRFPDYVKERLSMSLYELELLQRSVDMGVREAAKTLVDRFMAAPCS